MEPLKLPYREDIHTVFEQEGIGSNGPVLRYLSKAGRTTAANGRSAGKEQQEKWWTGGIPGGTLTMREHFDTFKRPGETV